MYFLPLESHSVKNKVVLWQHTLTVLNFKAWVFLQAVSEQWRKLWQFFTSCLEDKPQTYKGPVLQEAAHVAPKGFVSKVIARDAAIKETSGVVSALKKCSCNGHACSGFTGVIPIFPLGNQKDFWKHRRNLSSKATSHHIGIKSSLILQKLILLYCALESQIA